MTKVIDYNFKRGDTYNLKKFKIKDKEGNEIILTNSEKLYFTMKTSTNVLEHVLQKRIGSGIELQEDGYYHITMESKDTKNLDYGEYFYDIELKSINPKELVKTLIEGTISLEEEVTWGGNE